MEKQLREIYTKLAIEIDEMIPIEWDEIYYLGEMSNDGFYSSIFYFLDSETKQIRRVSDIIKLCNLTNKEYFGKINKLSEILVVWINCFEDNEQEIWNQVSMKIQSDGKFKVDYLYNTIDGNDYGPVKREAIWAYETFGYMDEPGDFSRTMLDEYLAEKILICKMGGDRKS